jgi:periplasmic protein CpxP/Spy
MAKKLVLFLCDFVEIQYQQRGETMLKHSLLTAALAGVLISGAPLAVAQDSAQSGSAAPQTQDQESGGGRHHHEMDPARRAQHLTKKLDLTADQQSKVQGLLQDEKTQMQSLKQDTSGSQQDRRAKFMEVHKNTDDQIRAILTPEQQKKWDDIQSKREERMMKHHGGSDQGSSSQPPQ